MKIHAVAQQNKKINVHVNNNNDNNNNNNNNNTIIIKMLRSSQIITAVWCRFF